MVPVERIALTRATEDMGFTDPPAYFNGLNWDIGLRGQIRTDDPLIPNEMR